jgi:hypothetical protein
MEEVLKYTESWLIAMLIQGKPMDGHDFNSMLYQNTKELRTSGVHLPSRKMDGVYYALCLIDDHYDRELNMIRDTLDWRWDFIRDVKLSIRPTSFHTPTSNLLYNLWYQLKQVKEYIDNENIQTSGSKE